MSRLFAALVVLAFPLGISAGSLPPQKILLNFGGSAPFSIVPLSFNGFTLGYLPNPLGTTPPATYTNLEKQQIRGFIEGIFEVSGITNIQFVAFPVFAGGEDVTNVYFGHDPTTPAAGYTVGGVDRFNQQRFNEVIVYNVDPRTDAETAAHELGHALGLRHVDPGVYTDPTTQLRYVEVMRPSTKRPPDTDLRFIDRRSAITDPVAFSSHNPSYHLKRYVEGFDDADLVAAGTFPGTWDRPSPLYNVILEFTESVEPIVLHHVRVLGGGDSETATVLAAFEQITLSNLSQQVFQLREGESLRLVGSSGAGGPVDVALARGSPGSLESYLFGTDNGTISATLLQEIGGIPTPLASGTVQVVTVPEGTSLAALIIFISFLARSRKTC